MKTCTMRIYPLAPDAASVQRHFLQVARGELERNGRKERQIGFGNVGSRFRWPGGASILRPSQDGQGAQLKEQLVTPGEVGVQQARSELVARELQSKKTKKKRGIKAPACGASKQKSSGKCHGKTAKKLQQKKTQKHKQRKQQAKKKSKKKSKSSKKDNFS